MSVKVIYKMQGGVFGNRHVHICFSRLCAFFHNFDQNISNPQQGKVTAKWWQIYAEVLGDLFPVRVLDHDICFLSVVKLCNLQISVLIVWHPWEIFQDFKADYLTWWVFGRSLCHHWPGKFKPLVVLWKEHDGCRNRLGLWVYLCFDFVHHFLVVDHELKRLQKMIIQISRALIDHHERVAVQHIDVLHQAAVFIQQDLLAMSLNNQNVAILQWRCGCKNISLLIECSGIVRFMHARKTKNNRNIYTSILTYLLLHSTSQVALLSKLGFRIAISIYKIQKIKYKNEKN